MAAAADSSTALGRHQVIVGLYSVEPEDFAAVAGAGFDVVQSYRFETTTPKDPQAYAASAGAYLDAAQAHGLSALLGLPRAWILAKDENRMRQAIEILRGHPALLAWYEDELGEQGHVDAIQILNQVIARSDSMHGLIIEENRRPTALDAVGRRRMFTYYPVTSTARKRGHLESLEDRFPVQQLQREFWPVLQIFGRDSIAGYPNPDFVVPTRGELQYSLYSAVTHGATGIFFYCYRQPTRYDPARARKGEFAYSDYRPLPDVSRESWESTVAVTAEARILLERIVAPGSVRTSAGIEGPRDLEAAQWNLGPYELVVIANPSYAPATVRVRAPRDPTRWSILRATGFSTPRTTVSGELKAEIPGPGGVAILLERGSVGSAQTPDSTGSRIRP